LQKEFNFVSDVKLLADVIEDCRDLNNASNGADSEFLAQAQHMKELLATKQNQLTSHLLQASDSKCLESE